MEEMKPKRGRPRKEQTTTPKPAKAKKGNQGRKPSGLEFTSIVVDVPLRDELREFGNALESETGEKFTMRGTIAWLLRERMSRRRYRISAIKTPDGE
jgi:hypothetical protein